MKELKQFKISCSAIGKIMAGEIGLTENQYKTLQDYRLRASGGGKPLTDLQKKVYEDLLFKEENPQLPIGAKSYCKKWLKRKLFNVKEDFKAIVIEKGLQVEPIAIELISKVYGLEGLKKNEDFFSNDYCHGEPDIIFEEKVRDNKSSWDLFSFPMFDDEIPEKDYWWQLQGYMWILGLKKASLDYTLIDTPMPLVLQDLKKLYYQSGGTAENWTPEKYEQMYPNYRFDNVPTDMRVKSFEFDFEEWVPEQIIYRVNLCREYINTLLPKPIENGTDIQLNSIE